MAELHLSKPALRALGIAESFLANRQSSWIAGVVMRGDLRVDGVAFSQATVGGDDATEAVLEIYEGLRREDVNVLILSGAVISWFNIIDIQQVFERVERPVVSLTYEESSGLGDHIRRHFSDPEEKLRRYERLGARERVWLGTGYDVYIRSAGASTREARALLDRFTLEGRIPEPVRLARLAARAALRACQD